MYKIYTDSPANLPEAIIEKYEIEVIPLHYTINGKEHPSSEKNEAFFDGKSFYAQMREGHFPHTSMINTHTFYEAFASGLDAGWDILYISISSGVSGTHQAAAAAAESLKERHPQGKIAIVDTLAASLGEGLCVLYAAELRAKGATFEEAITATETRAARICQYFTVEDLSYLRRGGRISGAAALVGNILHIKPILMGNEEGKIVLSHKTRGKKKAIEALLKKYQELDADKNAAIGISHGDCLEEAEALAQSLRKLGQRGEIIIDFFEPVTGSHAGPGALALFFYGTRRS